MKEKNRGGRPTLAELSIQRIQIKTTLTLYRGFDDDLIDWFDSIPRRKRAQQIKIALRQGGMTVARKEDSSEEFIDDDLLDELLSAL